MDSLNEELNAMRSLLALIQQEQAQLAEANIEALQQLTQEKAEAIALIARLANTRHSFLASNGLPAKDASMQTWLEKTASGIARQTWDELVSVAESAKELNRINGLLINKFMTRNQTALSILQGNGQGNNFYGPNGQATSKPSPRRLVIG